MKRKKLVKKALKNPDFYDDAELQYMKMWLRHKKQEKQLKANISEPKVQ